MHIRMLKRINTSESERAPAFGVNGAATIQPMKKLILNRN